MFAASKTSACHSGVTVHAFRHGEWQRLLLDSGQLVLESAHPKDLRAQDKALGQQSHQGQV